MNFMIHEEVKTCLIFQSSLRIPSARGEHAGTYSCSANNSLGDAAEVTALLVVTGLVPRFAQLAV